MRDPKEFVRIAGLAVSCAFLLTGYFLGLTLLFRKPASFSLEAVILYSSEIILYIVGLAMFSIFSKKGDE